VRKRVAALPFVCEMGLMNRRELIALLAGAGIAWPKRSQAQQAHRAPIVGYLHPGYLNSLSAGFDALRLGLRDYGYVLGENIKIEARWGQGRPETLPQLTRELVQLRADVLVVTARPAIEAARRATSELPIIASDLESDPIASGFIENFAHPGGNVTGFFLDAPDLCSKWLQQLREILPGLRKIAVLWDSTTGRYQLDAIRAAAKPLSIDVQIMEYRNSEEMLTALDLGLKENPQAVVQLGSPLANQAGQPVAETLFAHRIPGLSQFRSFTDGGGLMSYGPDLLNLYRHLATYVVKILRGARPAELPVDRPTKFDLVINLRTAKALGLDMPATLLGSADQVIE